jgi:hypothetical protein
MMPLVAGMQGALLLAWGRPDGLRHVEDGYAGALRSFWAAALCLPGFLFLRLLDWSTGGMPANLAHAAALELLSFVIGWAAFALASRPVAIMLGREDHWPRYLAAWNWCNVVQYLMLVAAALPRLLGAPVIVDETAGLFAFGWALWVEWYATRLALDVGRLQAAGMVLLDLAIGLGLSGLVAAST